eukprot:g44043.t1
MAGSVDAMADSDQSLSGATPPPQPFRHVATPLSGQEDLQALKQLLVQLQESQKVFIELFAEENKLVQTKVLAELPQLKKTFERIPEYKKKVESLNKQMKACEKRAAKLRSHTLDMKMKIDGHTASVRKAKQNAQLKKEQQAEAIKQQEALKEERAKLAMLKAS